MLRVACGNKESQLSVLLLPPSPPPPFHLALLTSYLSRALHRPGLHAGTPSLSHSELANASSSFFRSLPRGQPLLGEAFPEHQVWFRFLFYMLPSTLSLLDERTAGADGIMGLHEAPMAGSSVTHLVSSRNTLDLRT